MCAVRSIPLPEAATPAFREPRLLFELPSWRTGFFDKLRELAQPRLLLELPSWRKVFFDNLRDLLHPPKLAPLRLISAPAPFWPDVLVQQHVPWRSFTASVGYHVVALAAVGLFAHWLVTQPQVLPSASFDRNQDITYQPTEYLPPINTLRAEAGKSPKADPAPAAQPIICVPAEGDNRQQNTGAPDVDVRLKRDMALPNVVGGREKDN